MAGLLRGGGRQKPPFYLLQSNVAEKVRESLSEIYWESGEIFPGVVGVRAPPAGLMVPCQ